MGKGQSGGDVEYILRADDSKIEADLNQANKKVEKAVKKSADVSVKIEEDKTRVIKKETDKTVKNAQKASEDVTDAWESAGNDAKQAMKFDIEDKEVNIDVKADTAKAEHDIGSLEADDMQIGVDADTGKAESAIENVSRDKNIDVDVNANASTAREEIESLADVAENAGDKISDSLGGDGSALGSIGGALKSGFSDAASSAVPLVGQVGELTAGLSGATAAATGIGAAAVGAGALAVSAADDMKGAMNGFLAETGKSKEETERYQAVLEDIYANNYGESFTDIAGAMSQVTKNLGDMDDIELQNITESAFALRDMSNGALDVEGSTRAAKAMVDQFGIDGDKALSMIALGYQNNLDYSGELLDSISEYSVQFDKVGLDADDMFKIFEAGAESGAFNLDKVGDAVKEFSIRAIDGSESTREGFELLGLNADEMAAKFAEGGDSAKEAFEQTIEALAEMEDPLAQNTAGVDLFGTMWEDLGPEAVTAMAEIQDGAYDTADAMGQIKDIKYDDLGSQFETLKRSIEELLIPIGEALLPLLSTLIESILPVVTELLGPLISAFAQLLGPIVTLVSSAVTPLIQGLILLITTAIQPLMPVLNALMGVFTAVFNSISSTVTSIVGNITNIFRNLIDFVKNVFTGNWKGAWENVKNIFKNAVDALVGIFKAPINAIVDGWNSLAGSIGSVTAPDWVPIVGGKSFSLPKMSRLKVGLDYVPSDMFPAFLDEGEWVLTKDEANMLRSLGGVESMMSILNGTTGQDAPVIVQGAEKEIDYERLGREFADALIAARVGFKCDEWTFAYLIKDVMDYV